jgi:hypothetical protein
MLQFWFSSQQPRQSAAHPVGASAELASSPVAASSPAPLWPVPSLPDGLALPDVALRPLPPALPVDAVVDIPASCGITTTGPASSPPSYAAPVAQADTTIRSSQANGRACWFVSMRLTLPEAASRFPAARVPPP